MSYVEILLTFQYSIFEPPAEGSSFRRQTKRPTHTLIPSSEKQGGTADDSSSASESKIGNFSTADIGISPR